MPPCLMVGVEPRTTAGATAGRLPADDAGGRVGGLFVAAKEVETGTEANSAAPAITSERFIGLSGFGVMLTREAAINAVSQRFQRYRGKALGCIPQMGEPNNGEMTLTWET